MKKIVKHLLLPLALCCTTLLHAEEKEDIKSSQNDSSEIQEVYAAALADYEGKDWWHLLQKTKYLRANYPDNLFADELWRLGAIAFLNMGELEKANEYFSTYLEQSASPRHFEEVILEKFAIAERFRAGEKARLLGSRDLPKIAGGKQIALTIYEEVLSALPGGTITPNAYYGKGEIQLSLGDFPESIETFQQLIRRYPRHALASEAYVSIIRAYLGQAKSEYADPNFLDLAEINYKKFEEAFPSDEKLALAGSIIIEMREIYAEDLYATALFFERAKKPLASRIYYTKVLAKFPGTVHAEKVPFRLERLKKLEDRMGIKPEISESILPIELISDEKPQEESSVVLDAGPEKEPQQTL